MRVLITGGAGYIGSHTAVKLIDDGHDVTLLDNHSNSSPRALAAVRGVAGRHVPFELGDMGDGAFLDAVLAAGGFDAVLHFAAFKAVAESCAAPLSYYRNNVSATVCLLERMAARGVRALVFSSSATVYGNPTTVPIVEAAPLAPVNPYGHTKLAVENLLRDLCAADSRWRVSILRYFNPIGAHPSGLIGEAPQDTPNNLMPHVAQVAAGRRDRLLVFGNDYPTPDGTCVRDYIHVMDLAAGHARALEHLFEHPGANIHNLGTGRGYSVLEVVRAFETASGRAVPYDIVGRRSGDIATSYADPSRARDELRWTAQHDLHRMCEDQWRWQSKHPNGYD